jgi:hypothetical protein
VKAEIKEREVLSTTRIAVEEPHVAKLSFSDARFDGLWRPLRLYLG